MCSIQLLQSTSTSLDEFAVLLLIIIIILIKKRMIHSQIETETRNNSDTKKARKKFQKNENRNPKIITIVSTPILNDPCQGENRPVWHVGPAAV